MLGWYASLNVAASAGRLLVKQAISFLVDLAVSVRKQTSLGVRGGLLTWRQHPKVYRFGDLLFACIITKDAPSLLGLELILPQRQHKMHQADDAPERTVFPLQNVDQPYNAGGRSTGTDYTSTPPSGPRLGKAIGTLTRPH